MRPCDTETEKDETREDSRESEQVLIGLGRHLSQTSMVVHPQEIMDPSNLLVDTLASIDRGLEQTAIGHCTNAC